jgi:hypothetical protein
MVSKNNSPSLDLQELLQGNNSVLFGMCLINVGLRASLFWVITQRVVVIPYRRFRTTYWSHIQCPCTTACYVIIQKSADLIYFAAEGWNHVNLGLLGSLKMYPILHLSSRSCWKVDTHGLRIIVLVFLNYGVVVIIIIIVTIIISYWHDFRCKY